MNEEMYQNDQEQPQQEMQQPEQPQEQQQQEQESGNARNIRELREKKEQLERERDAYYQRLQEIEAAQKQKQSQETASQEDNLGPDDLVEWRHVQKHLKELREELNSYKQQTSTSTAEARLRTEYPDLDAIVNQRNLQELSKSYPELAQTLNSTSDFYTKAKSAYTLIKRLGIATSEQYEKDKQRAEDNAQKPRPLSSVNPQEGDSPLSHANAFAEGLTDDLRKKLWQEMVEAKKNL